MAMSSKAGDAAVPGRPGFDLGRAIKDAVFSALIALGLFGVIMGLKTEQAAQGLVLEQHWERVLWAVGIVFVGRLALNLTIWRGPGVAKLEDLVPTGLKQYSGFVGTAIGAALILVALTLPFLPGTGRYHVDLGTLVLMYVMLGWGLNIVVGLAGLLDLGYVAFYAVGAYSYALLATYFGLSFWICLPLAFILACFWGVILGFPVLRLRGDYLAIVTLAFGEIIRVVLLNWSEFTGGPNGIGQIPRPSFFGIEFTRGEGGFAETFGLEFSSMHRIIFLYYVILVLAFVTHLVSVRLRRLPIGRAWEAMREDEIACRSLGLSIVRTKLTAFAIGAGFGGLAGAFLRAPARAFISPESFTFIESALIPRHRRARRHGLAARRRPSAAVVMIGGFEYFREFEQYRMLVFRRDDGADHGLASARPSCPRARPRSTSRNARRSGRTWFSSGARLMAAHDTNPARGSRQGSGEGRHPAHRPPDDALRRPRRRRRPLVRGATRRDHGAHRPQPAPARRRCFNCITGFYKPTEGRMALAHGSQAALLPSRCAHRLAPPVLGRRGPGAVPARAHGRPRRLGQGRRRGAPSRTSAFFGGMTVAGEPDGRPAPRPDEGVGLHLPRPRRRAGLPQGRSARAIEKAKAWLERINLIHRADEPAASLPYGDPAPAGDRPRDVLRPRPPVPRRSRRPASTRASRRS